ncbi:4-(cytidine 5'-diphospho)-2-C-methyl-D-erythritol kinase [Lampropedia puyangensis]|uniref:4-diphosphocytidyl-2-C-methyl-D-erythritol kinase n=1 Tax=Lampropedia puyangensis TaxID=1330072 RepID=A0A4S8F3X0_9BURK|nr:4-(cytidine 5'-diphospho)-2-C-methyl-D-erythritol kinase [Lampropedia puyangensis]
MLVRLDNVLAPAKLNLFLHITGVREDGYHLLQSAFVMIDWCDVLHFEVRTNSSAITREDITQPLPAEDLIVRAARLLQQAAGVVRGVHIRIEKNIPAEAGLGGGSSDAASTLLALNQLWGLHWSREQLQQIGVQLGADVPFFIGGTNAWVEGIGEKLTPLVGPLALPDARFLVIKPQAGLSTAQIFSHPLLNKESACARITDFAAMPYEFGLNALQRVAEVLCPEVKKIIYFLKGRKLRAIMTGSGSAVFAKINNSVSGDEIDALIVDIKDVFVGSEVRVCAGLFKHPFGGV